MLRPVGGEPAHVSSEGQHLQRGATRLPGQWASGRATHAAAQVPPTHATPRTSPAQRAPGRPATCAPPFARPQVMEKLNGAIEKLYECERLPEDPLEFIAQEVTGRTGPGQGQASLKSKLSGSSKAVGGQ
ncbi:hypothetical protein PLESTB_000183800 [Pleodorina starrii]|uniref:Uncharacterized protein n=1 Tax=Pleodorina starrii TaxID=330485 RepID=A0A9W6BBR8_9CHLO|nr:hypothetical protein PLESTB_000183800 [Pleodorina starrii]GLC66092.1 hypothetical protein PLESTF_000383900 [Pleodorina starrii]